MKGLLQALGLLVLLSVPLLALAATGRLLWCVLRALRAGRAAPAAAAAGGVLLLGAAFAVVAVAWFAYGLSHGEKGIGRDLTMIGLTVLPFDAAAIGAWVAAGRALARLPAPGERR